MSAIGQLLHAGTSTYYTPWQWRKGNAAVLVVDIIAIGLTAGKFQLSVQTKNSDQDDSAPDSLGTFPDIASLPTSPPTLYASGFRELYRLKVFSVGAGANDWMHWRQLASSWLVN